MPLEAIAINDFNTQLMREFSYQGEFKARIHALYQDMALYQDVNNRLNKTADEVMAILSEIFANQQGSLYVGMFNDKPICAIACFIDKNSQGKCLEYLAMHAQNQNRGIEPQFIRQVVKAESAIGVHKLTSRNSDIQKLLEAVEN
ncbi:MAG: hypothetical protein CSA42_01195 [Gammaproteobacteria bacterium]|nr:MAG: hypothetical protein CSA42_01195 [Gammaproteobacteria bacterium]